MRSIIAFFFFIFFQNTSQAIRSAFVVDATTKEVIFEKNADLSIPPASLTKLMTFYILFDALKSGKVALCDLFVASPLAAAQPPCKIYVRSGERISVQDCILAMATKSANDVAVVVAESLMGSVENFCKKMNQKAAQLGMSSTRFFTASGWPHPEQRTNARDMAILLAAIRDDFPEYYGFLGTRQFTYKGRHYFNHNSLLGTVTGVEGGKTGFTNLSGHNLALSVNRDDKSYIFVVMGGRSKWERHNVLTQMITELYDKGRISFDVTRQASVSPKPRLAQVKPVATHNRSTASKPAKTKNTRIKRHRHRPMHSSSRL